LRSARAGTNQIHEEDVTPFLLILAILLGFAPGMIAHGKGRNFFLWWVYGVVLGPIALVHAILLHGTRRPHFAMAPRRRPTRWDSPWPLLLWAGSSFAVAIIAIAAYHIVIPARSGQPADSREVAVSADRGPWKESLPAPQQPSIEREPPAAMATPLEPSPAVRVTIRRDDTPPDNPAQTQRAQAAPVETLSPKPAAAPQKTAAPQSPAPTTVQLERTMATTADSVPAQKAAQIEDVRMARATPAQPVEPDAPAMTEPESAAKPRDKASHTTMPKQHVERRPAAAKPVPTDVNAIGETVRAVQQALAVRGYDPGPANGRAGSRTQLAIRKFQADRGLEPTGSIDYAVLENLSIVGPRVHAFQPPPGATVGR
jgi:hypothetical protein